jgi:hypothetical protein
VALCVKTLMITDYRLKGYISAKISEFMVGGRSGVFLSSTKGESNKVVRIEHYGQKEIDNRGSAAIGLINRGNTPRG